MKKVFKAAFIAISILLATSIAVNAQGNAANVNMTNTSTTNYSIINANTTTTNASVTNPSGGAYGNITQNANNVTSPPHAPGFESIFVVTGLASAAYIASRRRR